MTNIQLALYLRTLSVQLRTVNDTVAGMITGIASVLLIEREKQLANALLVELGKITQELQGIDVSRN